MMYIVYMVSDKEEKHEVNQSFTLKVFYLSSDVNDTKFLLICN